MKPYYADDTVTLYHGDMREVLPLFTRAQQFPCAVADPPYAETSLAWDRWPDGWPSIVAEHTTSMWCFGSLRMFGERWSEFGAWKMSQDIVWRKQNGSRPVRDRFVRTHEQATHWYRGPWSAVYRDVPRRPHAGPRKNWRASGKPQGQRAEHTGEYGWTFGYEDDGTRLQTSVIDAPNRCQNALHPTEKPIAALALLIHYACPHGGTVLDPFAGSGSTAVAARMSGRRAVLIEGHEPYCEAIANRLQQDVLPLPLEEETPA